MLSTSCITTPQFSSRSCSLFKSAANTETPARAKHTAPIVDSFIDDLHGQSFFFERLISSKWRVEGPSTHSSFEVKRGSCVTRLSGGHSDSFRTRISSELRRRARQFLPPTPARQAVEESKLAPAFLQSRGSARHQELSPGGCS